MLVKEWLHSDTSPISFKSAVALGDEEEVMKNSKVRKRVRFFCNYNKLVEFESSLW